MTRRHSIRYGEAKGFGCAVRPAFGSKSLSLVWFDRLGGAVRWVGVTIVGLPFWFDPGGGEDTFTCGSSVVPVWSDPGGGTPWKRSAI